jgi:hypothetical protein
MSKYGNDADNFTEIHKKTIIKHSKMIACTSKINQN